MVSSIPGDADSGWPHSEGRPIRSRHSIDWKTKTLGFTERKYCAYVVAVGEATLSLSNFQETMDQLFWEVCLKFPQSVFPNDVTNREMKASSIKICSRGDAIFADVKWIHERFKELEHDLNNVSRALFRSSKQTDMVSPAISNNKAWRNWLSSKEIIKEYHRLRDTAIFLSDFCSNIAQAIGDNDRPWPERPRLPCRAGTTIPPPARGVAI